MAEKILFLNLQLVYFFLLEVKKKNKENIRVIFAKINSRSLKYTYDKKYLPSKVKQQEPNHNQDLQC